MKHTERVMPGLSPADILETIRAAAAPAPNRDPDWKTTREWAQAWGVSAMTALRELGRGLDAKLIERRDMVASYTRRSMPHYRFTGKRKR